MLGAGIAVVSVVAAGVMIRTSATLGRTQPVSYAVGGGSEETALVETLGRPYEVYRTHTKRLVPGLW